NKYSALKPSKSRAFQIEAIHALELSAREILLRSRWRFVVAKALHLPPAFPIADAIDGSAKHVAQIARCNDRIAKSRKAAIVEIVDCESGAPLAEQPNQDECANGEFPLDTGGQNPRKISRPEAHFYLSRSQVSRKVAPHPFWSND